MTSSTGGVGNAFASAERVDNTGDDDAEDLLVDDTPSHSRRRSSGKQAMSDHFADFTEDGGEVDFEEEDDEDFDDFEMPQDAGRSVPPPPPTPTHPDEAGSSQGSSVGGKPSSAARDGSSSFSSASSTPAASGKARAASSSSADGAAPFLKPLNIGGSGASKYRPKSKKGVVGGTSGVVEAFGDFASSMANQAAMDRAQQARIAQTALEEARVDRAARVEEQRLERELRAEELRVAREEARAERESQMAVAAQQMAVASKCNQQ